MGVVEGDRVEPGSVDEAIDWLRKHFQPDSARGLDAVYAFELGGEGGGPLLLRIADGSLEARPEPVESADVRLRLPARDYYGILVGRENADLLYMAGRLEIDGDLSLAMKLRSLFRRAAS